MINNVRIYHYPEDEVTRDCIVTLSRKIDELVDEVNRLKTKLDSISR